MSPPAEHSYTTQDSGRTRSKTPPMFDPTRRFPEARKPRYSRHAKDRLTKGVWSPFGSAFTPHGEVMLTLSKKPSLAPIPVAKPPDDADPESPPAPPPPPPPQPPGDGRPDYGVLPPVFHKGLGLGMGFNPQRFPRELLRSSEQRFRSCRAGHASSHELSESASEPYLRGTHMRPAPTPVVFTPREPEPEPEKEGAPAAADDEPPAAEAEEEAVEEAPPSPRSLLLARMPMARLRQAEFKTVQRASRLRLEAALEERQRIRESVYALRHSQAAVPSLVLSRRGSGGSRSMGNLRSGSSRFALKSTPVPVRVGGGGGGAAKSAVDLHGSERRRADPSAVAATPAPASHSGGRDTALTWANGTGVATVSASPAGYAARRPRRHLARSHSTLWHDTAANIAAADGGGLSLWHTLQTQQAAMRRKEDDLYSDAKRRAADFLINALRRKLEAPSPPRIDQHFVEALYEACATQLQRAGEAREALLPMLAMACAHAGLHEEDVQQLETVYATIYKPKPSPVRPALSPDKQRGTMRDVGSPTRSPGALQRARSSLRGASVMGALGSPAKSPGKAPEESGTPMAAVAE